MTRPIVIVESPYAGPDQATIDRNVAYARAAMRDCLLRGEAPYASHLLYTQPGVLADSDLAERALGIESGFAFRRLADRTVVYTDLGESFGMTLGIRNSHFAGVPIEYRTLPGWAAVERCSDCGCSCTHCNHRGGDNRHTDACKDLNIPGGTP